MQRTNILAGEFSPSGIETARCYRRIYLQKVLGLSPIFSTTALEYGSAIHAGVEAFYGCSGKGLTLPDVQRVAVAAFVTYWQEAGCAEDKKHTLGGGILTMNDYCSRYWGDIEGFVLEDIESEQWCPMPNGTSLLVKMDRVFNTEGRITVVDTKTTGMSLTDYYFRQFDNQMQTTLYAYVVGQMLGRCDSIQIDAIKKPPPTTARGEGFARQSFIRTPLQIQDAVNSYCSITDYIMAGVALPEAERPTHFFCNQAECSKYSGCPYLPICQHGLDHPTVGVNFTCNPPKPLSEVKADLAEMDKGEGS